MICRGLKPSLAVCLVLAGLIHPAAARTVRDLAARPAPRPQAEESSFERSLPELASDPDLDLAAVTSHLDALLLADAADGRLDQHTLFEAALVANGTREPAIVERYETRLAGWRDELMAGGGLPASPHERARALLEFLYRRVFTGGYQVECTDLVTTLDTGRYNCVSATVLFNALAERLGLSPLAVECPAHVFSRLVLPDEVLDVETTCPGWFDLPAASRQTGHPALSDGRSGADDPDAGRQRAIGALELVAIVYYNRGVDQIERRQYREAVASNLLALRLDPRNAAARTNLLAALNNWALAESGAGEFARAVHLLEAGLRLAPAQRMFHVNYLAVHEQWVERLVAADRHQEALAVLARAASRLPDEELFPRAARDVRRAWEERSVGPACRAGPNP